ncbi:hypothetical protein QQM79_01600 [Marinobacteraceae bacterium S3BR75-40.1]
MRVTRPLLLAAAIGSTMAAQAGVKTLSSDEMVDTYIKDSAIIVVPKQRPAEQEKEQEQKSESESRSVTKTLTISPGEPPMTEAEREAVMNKLRDSRDEQWALAEEVAKQEQIRKAAFFPQEQLAAAQPVPEFTPLVPPTINGQQIEIPDAPFTKSLFGDQLGLMYDGQTLNFSIGNLPGVDQIEVPKGINEGPIQLTPRPGGGFDMAIQVPQD